MPYIRTEDRHPQTRRTPKNPGQLNYAITLLCKEYLASIGYNSINEVIGVLECVKQEFYRRVAVPYEDEKIEENGDVF